MLTCYVSIANLTLSIDELVREYLEEFAGKREAEAEVDEFMKLVRESNGDSRGWKWNREDAYERP